MVVANNAGDRLFVDSAAGNDYVAVGCTRPVVDFVTVIAQQCRRRPDSCAVIASDRKLTYHDLAFRVAGLAERLAASGVKSGSLVGICMPRGADELTAMLATVTLEAAYVPLDPAQPASRLAMIIADADPDVMIAKRSHPFPGGTNGVPTVFIDDRVERGNPSVPVWAPRSKPDALAYVLFTSGSTGRPKGVEIPRSAASNLLASMTRAPGLRESDVLLAVSTTMFDISALELFGPLCVGGTVRIADSDVIKDGRLLREVLDRERISVMQATPTMWHMLVDSGWSGDGRLRMLVGGEALSPDLARQLLPHGELWNMYGPTETTVWSTCKRIERPGDITIGRPIDNTQIYVLDGRGRLLPPGETGELCIGGAGLARGYLGQPDLTAERFIQNPLGRIGDRIYRTGDLVRLLDTGEYVCLGRVDHQVKIRGFRIELGEIEHALGDLPGVNRAVVIKWEPAGGTPALVAYVMLSSGTEFEPSELSRQLRDRLPAYMIPGRYIRMTSFPLTPNRKIDRGALPDPADALDVPGIPQRGAPRTETERTLLRIWSEVLGRQNIAVDDDFFDLGGQSVLAVRVCDRIHRVLAVDLAVSALLDRRTIHDLAAHIDGLRSVPVEPDWSSVVPVQPNGSRLPIFCVSGGGGNPVTFLHLADALGQEQPVYGLQHRGVDGRRRPHESIEDMARECLQDIRSVRGAGPYILAGYSDGGLTAYEMAQALIEAGEQVRLLILFDTVRPSLTGWSRSERAQRHWDNLKAGGRRYVVHRTADRASRVAADIAMRIRSRLAARWPYRFRMDAVEIAGRRAAAAYVPQRYRGDVLLFQSDLEVNSRSEIPVKQHDANGWDDLIGGQLQVVRVGAGHLGIVEEAAVAFLASEINRALLLRARVTEGTV